MHNVSDLMNCCFGINLWNGLSADLKQPPPLPLASLRGPANCASLMASASFVVREAFMAERQPGIHLTNVWVTSTMECCDLGSHQSPHYTVVTSYIEQAGARCEPTGPSRGLGALPGPWGLSGDRGTSLTSNSASRF